MDPNNNSQQQFQQQTPTVSQPTVPPMQQPTPQPIQAPPVDSALNTPPPFVNTPKGGHKLTFLLIFVLLILVGALGVIYFLSSQQNNTTAVTPTPMPTAIPSPTLTPTPALQDPQDIEIESPETDLEILNAELKAL